MARTTINIDTAILRELKERAHREHRPLGEVVSDLLARALEHSRREAEPVEFEWVAYDMGESLIDLHDWPAVLDFLDDEIYRAGQRDADA